MKSCWTLTSVQTSPRGWPASSSSSVVLTALYIVSFPPHKDSVLQPTSRDFSSQPHSNNKSNIFSTGVHCATQADIDQHLALGMNLLARGSYSDALSHFHAAVDADPNNYMSYYKRATVYMALSRPRPALADLDKIMQIKPDFLKARQQRGGLLLKMGRLNEVS